MVELCLMVGLISAGAEINPTSPHRLGHMDTLQAVVMVYGHG